MPFALSFGDYRSEQVSVPFALHESTDGETSQVRFLALIPVPAGVPFTLHKTYAFDKDEYLFELRITIENSVNEYPALDFGGYRLHPELRSADRAALREARRQERLPQLRLLG